MSDVTGFSSGGSSHIEDPLTGSGGEGEDGEEGASRLEHVVAGEVFLGGSDGDGGLVDLEADLGPISDRLQVDLPLHQGLGQVFPLGLEGVGSDGDWSFFLH